MVPSFLIKDLVEVTRLVTSAMFLAVLHTLTCLNVLHNTKVVDVISLHQLVVQNMDYVVIVSLLLTTG